MMKTIYLLTALLFMETALLTHSLGQDRLDKKAITIQYEGTLAGKLPIRMTLTERTILRTADGETFAVGTHYSGYYLYVKQGKRISVQGDYNAQGIGGGVGNPLIELEETVNGKYNGYFAGHFNNRGVYSGTWHSATDNRSYHFVLHPKR